MKGQEPQREGIGIRIFYLDLFFAVELLVDFFLILAAALLAGRGCRPSSYSRRLGPCRCWLSSC